MWFLSISKTYTSISTYSKTSTFRTILKVKVILIYISLWVYIYIIRRLCHYEKKNKKTAEVDLSSWLSLLHRIFPKCNVSSFFNFSTLTSCTNIAAYFNGLLFFSLWLCRLFILGLWISGELDFSLYVCLHKNFMDKQTNKLQITIVKKVFNLQSFCLPGRPSV